MIEILTLILASLMLVSTFIYVYFTYKLTQETTKLREIETSPFINAKLIIKSGFSKIYIENIGKSPAYNLNIKFEEETFKTIKSDCYKTYMSNIVYFGVGQVMDIAFRTQILMELNKEIVLNITYSSKDNQNFSETIHLSLGAEKDFGVFYPKSEYEDEFKKLTKELENIGKHVKKLTEKNNEEQILSVEDIDSMAKLYTQHKE
jgi:hypothetical protein